MTADLLSLFCLFGVFAVAVVACSGRKSAALILVALGLGTVAISLTAGAPLTALIASGLTAASLVQGARVRARKAKRRRRRMPYRRRAETASTARTDAIEVTLDETSGVMTGRILVGPLRGRLLTSLSTRDLLSFAAQQPENDQPTLALLTAYLDRMHPGWSDSGTGDDTAGLPDDTGNMSREQAFKVLGLSDGASPDEITDAHRRLIRRFHPDVGGSVARAAQINAAKTRLI